MPQVTVKVLLEEIRQAGYSPASGSWENSEYIHAFCEERGSWEATRYAPLYRITYEKLTGKKHVSGRPLEVTAAR